MECERAPNIRKPSSCCNCKHNTKGHPSVDCNIHPVKTAGYSFEMVCDDYSRGYEITSTQEEAVKKLKQPKLEPLQQIFRGRGDSNQGYQGGTLDCS